MDDPQGGDWKAQEPYNTGLASYQGDSNLKAAQDAYYGASQFRCPSCSIPVDGMARHLDGCPWILEQYRMMQNSASNFAGAGNVYRHAGAMEAPAVNIEPPKFFQF